MKVNLNTISHRARSFFAQPQFYQSGLPADFEVVLDGHDSILTVRHGRNSQNIDFLIAEIVAKFSINKKIQDVWKINFREIESFLRDENHLPAFTENISDLGPIVDSTKISLIAFALKAQLKHSDESVFSQRKNWNQLTLAAKNRWAQQLLAALGWELILCEDNVLTVTGTPVGVDQHALSDLINTILSIEENLLPMKVVAV